jgi:hypothetical protein
MKAASGDRKAGLAKEKGKDGCILVVGLGARWYFIARVWMKAAFQIKPSRLEGLFRSCLIPLAIRNNTFASSTSIIEQKKEVEKKKGVSPLEGTDL